MQKFNKNQKKIKNKNCFFQKLPSDVVVQRSPMGELESLIRGIDSPYSRDPQDASPSLLFALAGCIIRMRGWLLEGCIVIMKGLILPVILPVILHPSIQPNYSSIQPSHPSISSSHPSIESSHHSIQPSHTCINQ